MNKLCITCDIFQYNADHQRHEHGGVHRETTMPKDSICRLWLSSIVSV